MKTILTQLNEKVIRSRMKQIEDISLENDEYNDLYMKLRDLETAVRKVIKSEVVIDQKIEDSTFWADMRKLREDEKDLNR